MKLFATVSVLCLGVAAVANTQSHSKAIVDGYKADASGNCTIVVSQACTDGTTADCVAPGNIPLFEQSSQGCTTRLAKK